MSNQIKLWEGQLKAIGLGVKDRDGIKRTSVDLIGADGSILEVIIGNRYIRVVDSKNPPTKERPFATFHICSREHPTHPKTDFFGYRDSPEYMNTAEVDLNIIDVLVETEKGGLPV